MRKRISVLIVSTCLLTILLQPVSSHAATQGACPLVFYSLSFSPKLSAVPGTTTIGIDGVGSCIADDGEDLLPAAVHDLTLGGATVAVDGSCEALVGIGTTVNVAFTPSGPKVPTSPIVAYVGSLAGGVLVVLDDSIPFVGLGELVIHPLVNSPLLAADCSETEPFGNGVASAEYLGSFAFADLSVTMR